MKMLKKNPFPDDMDGMIPDSPESPFEEE